MLQQGTSVLSFTFVALSSTFAFRARSRAHLAVAKFTSCVRRELPVSTVAFFFVSQKAFRRSAGRSAELLHRAHLIDAMQLLQSQSYRGKVAPSEGRDAAEQWD